jgi:hypothetical protein
MAFCNENGFWPSQAQEQAFADQICAQDRYSSADVAGDVASEPPLAAKVEGLSLP